MEASQPIKQPEEPRVEYKVVDEQDSPALDEVFDTLFELIDKNNSKK